MNRLSLNKVLIINNYLIFTNLTKIKIYRIFSWQENNSIKQKIIIIKLKNKINNIFIFSR